MRITIGVMLAPRFALALLSLALLAVGCGSESVADAPVEPIKVLLVGSKPTWSFRYLRNVWRRADDVALGLYLPLAERGPFAAGQIAELPATLTDWQQHQVVVLCEWDASKASAACVSSLARFVAAGGGLITVVDGQAAGCYRDDRWSSLLPVHLSAPAAARKPTKTTLAVATGAAEHAALQFCGEHAVEQVLPTLPAIYFSPSVASLAQDATALVLAEAIGDASENTPGNLPGNLPGNTVMAIRPVGAGTSLWIGTSELWRWRDPHGERYMDAFAGSAVRAVGGR